jgi:hypothetical protein
MSDEKPHQDVILPRYSTTYTQKAQHRRNCPDQAGNHKERVIMQYLLLIYTNEQRDAEMSQAELDAQYQQYNEFSSEVRQNGTYVGGDALRATSTATTVRVRDGKITTHDGPFAETHEQLGGYYVLDCPTLDDAIALAAKIPGAKHGSIEIRPVVVFS